MPLSAIKVTKSEEVLYQPLDDGAVMLNLNNEQYYGLGDVGARLWQLLDEHADLELVVTAMLEEYDVEEGVLRTDLAKFLDELQDVGLLSIV